VRVTEKPVIKIQKTVYDAPEKSDGKRILVMKIWPRGISKDKVDVWVKDVGTDRDLIKKWKSGKVGWEEFTKEYKRSLKGKENLLREIAEKAEKGTITLLCSCTDEKHCHRYLLKKAIEKEIATQYQAKQQNPNSTLLL
jgi:uncharacterized protein YeaO (DUF488 family)